MLITFSEAFVPFLSPLTVLYVVDSRVRLSNRSVGLGSRFSGYLQSSPPTFTGHSLLRLLAIPTRSYHRPYYIPLHSHVVRLCTNVGRNDAILSPFSFWPPECSPLGAGALFPTSRSQPLDGQGRGYKYFWLFWYRLFPDSPKRPIGNPSLHFGYSFVWCAR